MNARINKHRIYGLFYDRFHGKTLWRSREEQVWLDVAPVGREFGSPDYERLEILDHYTTDRLSSDEAMRRLGLKNLQELHQLVLAADLIVPRFNAQQP